MASSGNFPLWTTLVKGATNITLGGTRFDGTTSSRSAVTSFHVPTGTKWYVECLVKQATNYNIVFGLVSPEQDIATYIEDQSTVNGMIFHGYSGGDWRTNPLVNGSRQGFNALDDDSTSARVMAMTINRVDNEIKMYLDNTLITNGTISISATEQYTIFASFVGGANSAVHMNINCGHDSTGAGDFTAATNTDENGFGEFQYQPPSGFLAICSANMPTSSNIDPAETDDDIPTKQFGVVTLTGNGTARTISGLGFQPDFIFAKRRDSGARGYTVDSSRGFTKYLHPDGNFSEGTSSDGVTAATSDGFDIGGSLDYINGNTNTYVAWCWRANGGTTATNTSGTITTTVQANQAAGFSILTYAGANGSWGSTHQDTLGHGLSAAPEFMIFKERNATDASTVFHHSVGAGGGTTAAHNNLRIDNHDALYTNQSYKSFGGVMPTSTVITIEGNTTNLSTSTHVAYVWHGVDGYSKFGAYEGNGNTDGTFVYTGFRPRMVFCKQIDGGAEWACYDSERNAFNEMGNVLEWDLEAAEKTHASDLTTDAMMFFSNGFKLTGGGGGRTNQSGRTFVYGAWADVPFKYNNAKE